MDYNKFRESKNLINADMIRCIRTKYPKYTKVQQSMVCNPEKNGVCLLPAAEELLVSAFGPGPGLSISKPDKRNHENKEKPHRLYLRLSGPMMAEVDALMSRMCFASMQDFLEAAVVQMIERYRV